LTGTSLNIGHFRLIIIFCAMIYVKKYRGEIKMDKQLYVISHTHWDREWYSTFQQYTARLVPLLDDLIGILEEDENYKYFHLDGQTIVIEDYLNLRPYNKDRLYKLIRDGRIIIGPWYVMPDEFLISGESLIRNMQRGIGICKEIGVEPMNNGYVTDIFGHNSQFPQFLRNFGIDSAILFRGIGDYEKDTFMWQGADGSEVLTCKLDKNRCYSNFYYAIRWPFEGKDFDDDEMVERMEKLLSYSNEMAVSDILLMMDGVDHIEVEPELPRILKLLESRIPGTKFIHARLEDYIKAQRDAGIELEIIKGPLYNIAKEGLLNTLLKNVLASMVHLKQSNDECERLLTKQAEPLDFATGILKDKLVKNKNVRSMEPRYDFFKEAWKLLIQNHPHDSICGCSITNVHLDNEYRFRQVKEIGECIFNDAAGIIADSINTEGEGKDGALVVFNHGQCDYNGIAQIVFQTPKNHQFNFKFYDPDGKEIPYQVTTMDFDVERVAKFRQLIRFSENDIIKMAMPVKIPANGYCVFTYENRCSEFPDKGDYEYKKYYAPARYLGSMRTGPDTFDTGKIAVRINTNGTLSINYKESGKVYNNILAFEDSGDTGDGWVYRKPLMDSSYITTCGDADFSIESDGPFAAVFKISQRIKVPNELDGRKTYKRSLHREIFEIISTITLYKDSSRIEVCTEIDNTHADHRLRVLFPTNILSDEFFTKTPFDMQQWDIKRIDWSNHIEADTGVNPSQGVTMLSDITDSVSIYTKGLYEIEVTEDLSRTIVLSLFRAFRSEAGQPIAELGFMKRKMVFEYAVEFESAIMPQKALISGENWRSGLHTIRADKHEGKLPSQLSFVRVFGQGGTVISSLTREIVPAINKDKLSSIIRLYDASGSGDYGFIKLPVEIKNAWYIDFNGNIVSQTSVHGNEINYIIGPKKIVTIAFVTS